MLWSVWDVLVLAASRSPLVEGRISRCYLCASIDSRAAQPALAHDRATVLRNDGCYSLRMLFAKTWTCGAVTTMLATMAWKNIILAGRGIVQPSLTEHDITYFSSALQNSVSVQHYRGVSIGYDNESIGSVSLSWWGPNTRQ